MAPPQTRINHWRSTRCAGEGLGGDHLGRSKASLSRSRAISFAGSRNTNPCNALIISCSSGLPRGRGFRSIPTKNSLGVVAQPSKPKWSLAPSSRDAKQVSVPSVAATPFSLTIFMLIRYVSSCWQLLWILSTERNAIRSRAPRLYSTVSRQHQSTSQPVGL